MRLYLSATRLFDRSSNESGELQVSAVITRRASRAGVGLAALVLVASWSSFSRAQSGTDGAQPVFQSKPAQPAQPQGAQPPASESQGNPKAPNIRVQSILVTTPVTVIDHSGEYVSDLDEKDFKVYDNGVQQPLQRFEVASEPVALVILVQTDNSMASLLYQLRGLGPMFSDLLVGPDGHTAVMGVSDKVTLLQGFSNDRDQLKGTLGRLEGFGMKARLNDALMQAMRLLEDRPETERRVIVAFSDGSDHGSENSKADVVHRATADEVTIYGLHLSRTEALVREPEQDHPLDPLDANVTRPLPPGVVPTPTNSANVWGTPIQGVPILTAAGETVSSVFIKNALEYYAGFTGGVYYSHWTKNKLEDQLNQISAEIHSQYEIAYKPTTLAQNGFHRIDVEIEKPNLKVRARAGYFYQQR
jgi:VWFA-related protein